MPNYTFPSTGNITFGARDARPPGDPEKAIVGAKLDIEYVAIAAASATKLETADPAFTGTMTGGTIDGGSF
jgi:hypothetical protein